MSLGKGIYMPPPDSTKYEIERYESMTDEQKIDYQLAQMNQPKIIYRDSSRSRKSNDEDLSLMGGLIIGGMLF